MDPSPFEGQHPDAFGHALSAAGQKVAELTALATMVGQLAATRHARRAEREAGAGVAREAETAAARTVWAPVLDPGWRADAGVLEVTQAWAVAVPHADSDPGAAAAVEAAEAQLRQLHPYAMRRYDQRRAGGAEPATAMLDGVGDFAAHPQASGPGQPPGAPGLSDAEASILRRLLTAIARLSARSQEAGQGPLRADAVRDYLGDTLPPGMAGRVAEGIAAGQQSAAARAEPPWDPAPRPTVASLGPAALAFPSTARDGVTATALRSAAGGRGRGRHAQAGAGKSPERRSRRLQ